MKFITILIFSILFTVSVGSLLKISSKHNKADLISPLVAGASTVVSPSITGTPNHDSIFGWQIFVNNYYGYKIKHPSDVNIKNMKNGDISLQRSKSINLSITQDVLPENDSINTVIEKVIDGKKNGLKEKFNLINTISPIAIGSVTAQTYSSIENGESISYYYIPQKNKQYLVLTNFTQNVGSSDYLVSEDMIYSLELIP